MGSELTFFAIGASIIIVGFVGNLLFEKTGLPDVLWLMLFGILIGPTFSLVSTKTLTENISIFAPLALIIILFDSGLQFNLIRFVKQSPRAIALAFLSFIFSVFSAVVFTSYFLSWNIEKGILTGAIVGATSPIILISMLRELRVRDTLNSLLTIESVLGDIIAIIVTISLLQIIFLEEKLSLPEALNFFFGTFSIGIVAGITFGAIWLIILTKIRGRKYSYMLTIAILLMLYSVVEYVKGSGALAALAFGLMLGNGPELSRMFKTEEKLQIDKLIHAFEEEITFFVRVFFFVYLGAIVQIKEISFAFLWIALSFLLFFIRIVPIKISTLGAKYKLNEIAFAWSMLPRGLASVVLSVLPATYGYEKSEIFPDIAFVVIFTTTIIATIGAFIYRRTYKSGEEKQGDA